MREFGIRDALDLRMDWPGRLETEEWWKMEGFTFRLDTPCPWVFLLVLLLAGCRSAQGKFASAGVEIEAKDVGDGHG
jgi:hypothetical protein